ncbi:hypothetical protein K490DRAFT_68354 [Saccharata proteae CBS 121410]|uniref:TOM core complex subunit Tom6 n=1 Tax=Saccharata proteae CBS 121410 TaxID=1314787 RepID=A0A9P4HSD2_9PEZI|nr:hypothetical protein K490DRAFT_68354 [Saccharata proteae CBS 121410]
MPAKRASPPSPAEQGYSSYVYDAVTSSENRSIVTSLSLFVVGVAFLSSPLSEFLLPG